MIKIIITCMAFSVAWTVNVTNAEAPIQEPYVEEVKTEWTKDEVKEIAIFFEKKYSVSKLVATVYCESSFRYNAVNMQDNHKFSKGSWGTAQFSKETFLGFAKEMGKDYDDPMNPYQALDVMGYAFSKGYQNHWSCYKKIVK